MKASEEVIKKMVEEEKQKQEILKEDEMIAKRMQDEELDNVCITFQYVSQQEFLLFASLGIISVVAVCSQASIFVVRIS